MTQFIISQILMTFAILFDVASMQFKNRKYIYASLVISASLISLHYFFLDKITASLIVSLSIFRFITCYFTTNKYFMYLFLFLNTLIVIFNYSEIYDLIIFIGLTIFIIGNFQGNGKNMRKFMMIGTFLVIIYNFIIFSPMGVIAESTFLFSNIIGYYRFYFNKKKKI